MEDAAIHSACLAKFTSNFAWTQRAQTTTDVTLENIRLELLNREKNIALLSGYNFLSPLLV